MDVAGGTAGRGMMVFMLPIPRIPALLLIFGIAGFKATLVLRDYMHLKGEKMLIYAIALTPLLLAIALALVLIRISCFGADAERSQWRPFEISWLRSCS